MPIRTYTYYPWAGKRAWTTKGQVDGLMNSLVPGNGGGGFQQASPPTILPDSTSAIGSLMVTMSTTTPNGEIYYTLDGSIPDVNSLYYSGPFTITASAVVNAVTIAPLYLTSQVSQETYTITYLQVDTPQFIIQDANLVCDPVTFSPTEDYFSVSTPVAMLSATSGASIYYTLDNTPPTTSSLLYTAPITLDVYTNIRAIATKLGYANSGETTKTYGPLVPSTTIPGLFTLAYPAVPTTEEIFYNSWANGVSYYAAPYMGVYTSGVDNPLSPLVRNVFVPDNLPAPLGFFEEDTLTTPVTLYTAAQGFTETDSQGNPFKYIVLPNDYATPTSVDLFRWYACVPQLLNEIVPPTYTVYLQVP